MSFDHADELAYFPSHNPMHAVLNWSQIPLASCHYHIYIWPAQHDNSHEC